MNIPDPTIGTLILAAGESSRFKGVKQLARSGVMDIEGEPEADDTLIERACLLAEGVTPGQVSVVLGANKGLIYPKLPGSVQVIENDNWQQGMGSSIAIGVKVLQDKYQAILILLADQVALEEEAVSGLISRWEKSRDSVVCACYRSSCHSKSAQENNSPGVPAIFPQRLFTQLADLKGHKGAKTILFKEVTQKNCISMPEAAIDIDTPEQLLQWQKSRNQKREVRSE